MQVTKMPMTKKAVPRVCAYARVSTQKDEQEWSLANQMEYWERRFKNDPTVEYVGLFVDDGITGHSMKKRSGITKVIEMVRNGEIDEIYTKSISRFARNYTELTTIIREFRDMGIPIIFEKENINTLDPKSNLLLSVMASFAEEELVSMSKNLIWVIRKKYAEGQLRLIRIYGYDYKNGQLTINPKEAELVRKIFNWYLDGYGYDAISKMIDPTEYPPIYGAKGWGRTTICKMLRNEKYVGDSLLQKTVTWLGVVKPNKGEAPQYYVEDSHEGIVTRQVFDMVQQMRASRRARHYNPPADVKQTLHGKIVCGVCGENFRHKRCAKGTTYECVKWTCSLKDRNGVSHCASHDIKDEILKKLLVEAYNESLDSPLEIPTIQVERAKLQELLNVEQEFNSLLAKGYISEKLYKMEMSKTLAEIQAIENKIKEYSVKLPKFKHYEKSTLFNESMVDFLVKATVKDWTITFEFANGYKTTKIYTNGRAGNVNGKLCKQKA